jgi:hypothetical protein
MHTGRVYFGAVCWSVSEIRVFGGDNFLAEPERIDAASLESSPPRSAIV